VCSVQVPVFQRCRAGQAAFLWSHLVWAPGLVGIRDGNGDPILDFPRGIPPLGDEDGKETSLARI
jgi:hypothetical protein